MTSPWEEGDPSAAICILAEAPSRTEMRLGRPLVGPSGHLLEQCMHAAGLIRRECYIVNLFEFEVTKKKKGWIYSPDGELLWQGMKGFTEIGEQHCGSVLARLERASANIVCPLGGTALSFLYGDSRIMKWRGSILSSTRLPSRKIVPTIHPAASLHGNYLWRHLIISDLHRVKEESTLGAINLPKREFLINPGYDEVIGILTSIIKDVTRVAVDIEVTNHQVSCLAFATGSKWAICIPFSDGHQSRWLESEEEQIWSLIAEIMGHPDIEKIGQNIIFDIGFLLQRNGIITRGKISDTMIAHHIIWPDFPKGLDFLCSMHTREPYYKDDGKIWKNPWKDIESFWVYNAKDAATTFEIWEALQGELDKGYRQCYEDTIALFPCLLYMMQRGVRVDMEKLEETKKDVASRILDRENRLRDVSEREFNPTSPKQCQEYFYVTKGIKPYVSRQTGRPTTDDKAMSRIYRRHRLPEAKLVQEIRALRKLSGTYLEADIDKDSRVRCSYNPRGATTGRLSSSKTIFGTGMNLQNLHPEFKGFLVSDLGDASTD